MADEERVLVILDRGLENQRGRPLRPDMVQRPISPGEVAVLERLRDSPRFMEMMRGEIIRPAEDEDDVYTIARGRVFESDRELDVLAGSDGVWLSDDIGIAPDYAPCTENGRTVLSMRLHLFCGKVDVGPVDDIGIEPDRVTVTSGPLRLTVEREQGSFRDGDGASWTRRTFQKALVQIGTG